MYKTFWLVAAFSGHCKTSRRFVDSSTPDPGDVVARSGVNCLSLLMNDEDDAAPGPGPGTRRAEVEEGK